MRIFADGCFLRAQSYQNREPPHKGRLGRVPLFHRIRRGLRFGGDKVRPFGSGAELPLLPPYRRLLNAEEGRKRKANQGGENCLQQLYREEGENFDSRAGEVGNLLAQHAHAAEGYQKAAKGER